MNIIKQSLWETLVNSDKPVILYGMGNGADKILDYCALKNIKVAAIFASDEFARGHSFRGYPVKKLAEIQDIYKDKFCILLSFASNIDSVINKIYDLNDTYEFYVPNFPAFGENIYFDYDYYLGNKNDIEEVYNLLADDESKKVYENAVNFYISGKLDYLKPIESTKKSALDLLNLNKEKGLHYIDVGAYDGDTISELLCYYNNIKKITAFEPDVKNFAKLEKNLREKNLLNISELYNIGAWSKEDTLYFNAQSNRNSTFDFDVQNQKNLKEVKEVKVNSLDDIDNIYINDSFIKLIKYDVEGAELEALTGSREIIKKYSPKLIVSLYHKTGDIFRLPLYINNINADYKFYMRKHKYIPCWDLNLYAIPAL